MSYLSGWAAINMEFTDKVPRTEFSADYHWPLVKVVTGINTEIKENREKAQVEFIRIWDYAFIWSVTGLSWSKFFKKGRTSSMGHAVYNDDGKGETDFNSRVYLPFSDVEDALSLDCLKEYGEFDEQELIKDFEDEYSGFVKRVPDTLNMGGFYHTMFSGFIDIYGWDMLLTAMGTDEARFGIVVESYYLWVKQFFDAYAKSNIPVFMCHDDICWTRGPVAHPDWYRKYIFPYYKKLWQPIKESGKKIIFTSDGNYTAFLDDIVQCGADMLVFEPVTDMALFAEKYGKTHGFVGNADTNVLLFGTKEDIYNEVKRCMDIGKKYPGFILAVGNHIPINTPVDNALYYQDAYEKLSVR